MKSKTAIWVLSAAVLVAAAVWFLQDRSTGEVERTNVRAIKHSSVTTEPSPKKSVAAAITRMEDKDRHRIEAEGERLVKKARNALKTGDKEGFEEIIFEILHRYKGDPNPLLLEFSDVLGHNDPQARMWMAGIFLRTNLKVGEAVQVIRDIVRSGDPLMYGPERVELLNEEFPSSDYRFRAADILALYRIEEARDDVWNLYEKTGSEELIRPLRRLNDPRMIDILKDQALEGPLTVEKMRLLGEYRIMEALPKLTEMYADESLNEKHRFNTLYPLWRITGEEKYFDEFAASFHSTVPVPYLAVGGEKEREYLVEILKTEGSNTLIKAAMALHLRYEYDEPLIEMLLGYFHDLRSSNWKDGVLARRLVGSIDDPELTRVAEEYEAKYQTGFHDRYALYRKNWRYLEWEEALFMD